MFNLQSGTRCIMPLSIDILLLLDFDVGLDLCSDSQALLPPSTQFSSTPEARVSDTASLAEPQE
jgi:hypothetical protein